MIISKIVNCARCGGTHEKIDAKELSNHSTFTHFAMCPNKGEPIMVISDKKDKFDLDHYHYHEFLERCALLNNVIEEICDHPVKNAHGDLNDQVNKILDECGELYVMAGNKKFDFNDSVAADIRIN